MNFSPNEKKKVGHVWRKMKRFSMRRNDNAHACCFSVETLTLSPGSNILVPLEADQLRGDNILIENYER